eukprot:gene42984-52532_t
MGFQPFFRLLLCACVYAWGVGASSRASHNVEQDQSFIDLYDDALLDYETRYLRFTESDRDDFGIYRMPIGNNPNRFYRMGHNSTQAAHTHHSLTLDFGQICLAMDNAMAIQLFGTDHWSKLLQNRAVLVQTPCMGSDSLGNFLSNYFETLMCAQVAGVDYMALNFIYDPTHFVPFAFFDALPILMRHHRPSQVTSIAELQAQLKSACPCPGSCHERPYALWPRAVPGLA